MKLNCLKLNLQFFATKPPEPPKEPEPPTNPEPPKEPSEEEPPKWVNNFLTELKQVLKTPSTGGTTNTPPAQIPVPQPPAKPNAVVDAPENTPEPPKKKTGFLDWLL